MKKRIEVGWKGLLSQTYGSKHGMDITNELLYIILQALFP